LNSTTIEAPRVEVDSDLEQLLDTVDDDKVCHLVEYAYDSLTFRPVKDSALCGSTSEAHKTCPGTGPRPYSQLLKPCDVCGAPCCSYCAFIWENMMGAK
jgi:hypothetical protein